MRQLIEKIRNHPFLQIFLESYRASEIEISSIAVAYYLLISMFPLALIVVNILPYFQITVVDFLEVAKELLPDSMYEAVAKVVESVLTQPSTGLLSFSILSALWTFSKAMSFLQKAFNKTYKVEQNRGFIWQRLISLIASLGLQLLFVFSLILSMFGRMLLTLFYQFWRFDENIYQQLQNMTESMVYLLLFLSLIMVYVILPNKKITKLRYVFPGTLFVMGTIIGLLTLFTASLEHYVTHFVDVRFFGSVLVVVVMVWFIILSKILIIGAMLNSSYQVYKEQKSEKTKK